MLKPRKLYRLQTNINLFTGTLKLLELRSFDVIVTGGFCLLKGEIILVLKRVGYLIDEIRPTYSIYKALHQEKTGYVIIKDEGDIVCDQQLT